MTGTPDANEPRTRAASRLIIGLLVAATVAAVAFVGISVATRDPAMVHSFTIDAGTQALLDAGKEVPNPPPLTLDVELGDTLEVTNNDSSVHTYAFLVLRPGETGRYTFRNRGVFSGQCTASDHGETTITVT
ncbi:MAG: hypothetical protein ACO3RB_01405 [Ilumatobacteraceae bacterium]